MEKDTKNTFILELASYEKPAIIEDSREDWVEYGEDNLYYDWLIERYHNSPTNNSIINNMSRLIYGRGIHAKNASKKPNEYAAMRSIVSNDTLRKVIKELKMLGMGHFQVLKKGKKVVKIEHIETNLTRPEKCNDKGQVEAFYYSNNWEDTKKYPPKRIPAFSPDSTNEIEIMCIKPFTVGMKYFAMPDYEGCLPYAVLEEEIADYLINHVQNGFSGTKVINFNNGVPAERQMEIQANKVKAQLTGSNGDPVIVSFNSDETKKTTIDDVPLDDAPQHYEFLSKECQEKILNCHNVTSPMLVGVVTESRGFNSNADEIEVAARYFYNATIKSFQDLITDALDKILAVDGITLDLYFKRLNLLEEVDENEQKQEQIKEVQFSSHLDGLLAGFGETVNEEEWTLLDEREVDYDLEDNFDAQLKEYANQIAPKQTILSKAGAWLAGTGRANPNKPSDTDKEIDGFYFKVRYQYDGNPSPERDFCRLMMRAQKVYKKEDIEKMSKSIVNAGFGFNGADTYDIFKFKGGPRCSHKWKRRTYVSANKNASIGSEKTNEVSTAKAAKFGYFVPETKEGFQKPKDMPHKGFHPNNPNKPADAR